MPKLRSDADVSTEKKSQEHYEVNDGIRDESIKVHLQNQRLQKQIKKLKQKKSDLKFSNCLLEELTDRLASSSNQIPYDALHRSFAKEAEKSSSLEQELQKQKKINKELNFKNTKLRSKLNFFSRTDSPSNSHNEETPHKKTRRMRPGVVIIID